MPAPPPAGTISPLMRAMQEAALGAAMQAAGIRESNALNTRQKSAAEGDVVTAGDLAAQAYLERALPASMPDGSPIGLLGEEDEAGRGVPENALWRWVVDPIDGTKPYHLGEPYWSVSVALQEKQTDRWRSTHGVIYCASSPDTGASLSGRLFWAEANAGAYCLQAGEIFPLARPADCMPTAEFETTAEVPGADSFAGPAHAALVRHGLKQAWRRSICYAAMEVLTGEKTAVAQGVGPYEWDVAALSLIAAEAGAHVDTGPGEPAGKALRYHTILAWDEALFAELAALL